VKAVGRIGFIYVLRDPITNEIRYVGQTVSNPNYRLLDHCAPYKSKDHRGHWVASLRKRGLRPELDIVDVGMCAELTELERWWFIALREAG
jgi:hypothetical protein